jgi:hypothetical protein
LSDNQKTTKKRGKPTKNSISQEPMATPEQLKKIENMLGEPLEEFIKLTTDEYKLQVFANNLARSVRQVEMLTTQSSSNGKYQPVYSEQILKDININPRVASSVQIEEWLLCPQYFDENLRHLSQYLSYAVGQYNRALWYLNTIKSFNYVPKFPFTTTEDELSEQYEKDWNTYLQVLQKMNLKYNIPRIDAQLMYDGAACYYLVETNDTISMHNIPIDYCYITAPWTFGYTFAINLVYFDKFATLDNQVPELVQAYDLFVEMRRNLYSGKELAPYQYYQVPPNKGWVFTFDPIHPDKVPPLTSSMATSLDILSYKELLKNKLALDLYKVIALKIPLDKDNKQMAITYKLAEEITQVIQSTLPDNMKVFSSPFESLPINTDQANRFEDIINISNNNFSASTGFNQGLFGSNIAKQGTAIQLSSKVDFAYASTHLYKQYDNFVNYQIAIRTKKYRFGVRFFGNKIEEQKEIEMYSGLVRTTNSHLFMFFASTGHEPFEIKPCLQMENKLGLRDLMKPLVSAFNSKQESDGGRSKKNDSDLTDSGENTRDYGQSQEKMFALHNCINCGSVLSKDAVDGCFCNEECREEYAEHILEENGE